MFGLLHNLYQYVREKSERKVTFVLLGLDNAGKTTLISTLRGELDAQVAPTFGFNSSTLSEGKYTVVVYDLGGDKNMRRTWKVYLAEVHGCVYVVDSADPSRFAESRTALMELAQDPAFRGKPVLVLANKQDLPVSAGAAEVSQALGLPTLQHNSHLIQPCSARAPPAAQAGGLQVADPRARQGLSWLVAQVDGQYAVLGARVNLEAEVARQEVARVKREKDEAAALRRLQRELDRKLAAASPPDMEAGTPVIVVAIVSCPPALPQLVTETSNVLSSLRPMSATLPNVIESPTMGVMLSSVPPSPTAPSSHDFSDLRPRPSFVVADAQTLANRRSSHLSSSSSSHGGTARLPPAAALAPASSSAPGTAPTSSDRWSPASGGPGRQREPSQTRRQGSASRRGGSIGGGDSGGGDAAPAGRNGSAFMDSRLSSSQGRADGEEPSRPSSARLSRNGSAFLASANRVAPAVDGGAGT